MRFTEALDRKMEDIERPPNLPVGHYVWRITKHPEQDSIEAQSGITYDTLTFQCVAVSAMQDVDPDDLEAYGKIEGTPCRKQFMFDTSEDGKTRFDQSLFNVRRFLGHCGVDESLPMNEALLASVNGEFVGELKHRPDKNDPEVIYQEINTTAAV